MVVMNVMNMMHVMEMNYVMHMKYVMNTMHVMNMMCVVCHRDVFVRFNLHGSRHLSKTLRGGLGNAN